MDYVNNKSQNRVKISLKTSDPKEARRKADVYNEYIEDVWKDVVFTKGEGQEGKYRQAILNARSHGFVV